MQNGGRGDATPWLVVGMLPAPAFERAGKRLHVDALFD